MADTAGTLEITIEHGPLITLQLLVLDILKFHTMLHDEPVLESKIND